MSVPWVNIQIVAVLVLWLAACKSVTHNGQSSVQELTTAPTAKRWSGSLPYFNENFSEVALSPPEKLLVRLRNNSAPIVNAQPQSVRLYNFSGYTDPDESRNCDATFAPSSEVLQNFQTSRLVDPRLAMNSIYEVSRFSASTTGKGQQSIVFELAYNYDGITHINCYHPTAPIAEFRNLLAEHLEFYYAKEGDDSSANPDPIPTTDGYRYQCREGLFFFNSFSAGSNRYSLVYKVGEDNCPQVKSYYQTKFGRLLADFEFFVCNQRSSGSRMQQVTVNQEKVSRWRLAKEFDSYESCFEEARQMTESANHPK